MREDLLTGGRRVLLVMSEEVREAIDARRPVVALESTIIAHGLPRPRNLQVALELEAAVRREGAVPATIAVLDGRPRVGLDKEQLERIANKDGIRKLGYRDLPLALASGRAARPRCRRRPCWRRWRAYGCSRPVGSAGCTGSGR